MSELRPPRSARRPSMGAVSVGRSTLSQQQSLTRLPRKQRDACDVDEHDDPHSPHHGHRVDAGTLIALRCLCFSHLSTA